MKMSENIAKLVTELEPYIGGNCYNSRSYNGWTGEYGKHYRYPVKYVTKAGTTRKTRGALDEIDFNQVERMHYLTGTNEIYVGKGIVEILDELETRFGLDFNKLIEEEMSM